MLRGEEIEYIGTTGKIEGKRRRGKRCQMLDGLTKWFSKTGPRDRDVWKVMIANAKEQDT